VEFLLVSVPVLLLTLGGTELAHWFHVRQMVDLALMQAARAGTTQHAQPAAIAQAFEQALRPLFAAPTAQATDSRLASALRKRSQAMDHAPPWQIRILRPNAQDYARFAAPMLTIARDTGLPAIRNDYQYEQQQSRTHSGGSASGEDDAMTVFEANTLVLRLSYPHPPLLPGVARLIASLNVHTDTYARRALAAGLLPIVREVRLGMASHPVNWPSLPDGRVIQGEPLGAVVSGPSPGVCVGLWCQPQTLPTLPRPPTLTPPRLAPSTPPDLADATDSLPEWGPDSEEQDPDSGDGEDFSPEDECPAGCC